MIQAQTLGQLISGSTQPRFIDRPPERISVAPGMCFPHFERVGRHVPATHLMAGTPVCKACHDGRPILPREDCFNLDNPFRTKKVKPEDVGEASQAVNRLMNHPELDHVGIPLKGRNGTILAKRVHAVASHHKFPCHVRTENGVMNVYRGKRALCPLRKAVRMLVADPRLTLDFPARTRWQKQVMNNRLRQAAMSEKVKISVHIIPGGVEMRLRKAA